jgi:hypothetical protein
MLTLSDQQKRARSPRIKAVHHAHRLFMDFDRFKETAMEV